jgi:hypothetical protein
VVNTRVVIPRVVLWFEALSSATSDEARYKRDDEKDDRDPE